MFGYIIRIKLMYEHKLSSQLFRKYNQSNHNLSLSQIQSSHQYDIQGVLQRPDLLQELKNKFQNPNKTSYKNVNSLKPKIQSKKFHAESLRGKGKPYRYNLSQKKPKYQMQNQQVDPPSNNQHKINKIIQLQLLKLQQQHKPFVNINSFEIKHLISPNRFSQKKTKLKSPQKNAMQQQPQTTYFVNAFPKKELKFTSRKNKLYPLKGQIQDRNDELNLGAKFRKSLIQKLREIQDENNGQSNKKMLEMMTIFSIKEHQKQKQAEMQKKSIKNNSDKFLIMYKQSQQNHSSISPLINLKLYKRKEYEQQQLNHQAQNDSLYNKKIHSYMSFLIKVNFTNNIFIRNVDFCDRNNNQRVKVFVGEGNNKYLIIGLLKRRFWIQITNKINHDTKFVWTQNTIQQVHRIQKAYKLRDFESVDYLEKPSGLLELPRDKTHNTKIRFNTLQNPQSKSSEMQSIIQFNSKISKISEIKSASEALLASDLHENSTKKTLVNPFKLKNKKFVKKQSNKKLFMDLARGEKADKFVGHLKINLKKQSQMVYDQISAITNHVPKNSFIGSKKALFYTMEHYYRQVKKVDPFEYIPKTYHFKGGPHDQSYKSFLQNEKQVSEKSIWIVKPGECTNRGKGISIMKASDISKKLLKKQFHPNGQLKTTIVQSYITKPFLYNGRKFDIRHYMMITIVNGNLKAYWYADGYLRTSSEIYNLDDLKDIYIHLTNDAIQMTSQNYGKFQPGNKLSYNELQRYIDSHYPKNKINFREQILPKMKDIATDIIKANYKNIDRQRKMNNFEIFGLDFMLDNKLKPWLIQVNANPCLELNCPLLTRIIPIMVQHALRLGLDPLIMPTCHYPPNKRYFLSDNFIDKLKFQIIFDQIHYKDESQFSGTLSYDFQFDEPQDEYENNGAEIDLATLLD